jgi:glycine hydroxymethyltransferase
MFKDRLKSLREQAGLTQKELGEKIDKALFPGLQGGPHMNTMAALAVSLKEALDDSFKDYAHQVVVNAKALAEDLKSAGFKLIGNGTENHLILMDVIHSNDAVKVEDAGLFAEQLEQAGLVANKNTVPGDLKPWLPSGIRLGTPAVTTMGMRENEMHQIAGFIIRVAAAKGDSEKLKAIAGEVKEFLRPFTKG